MNYRVVLTRSMLYGCILFASSLYGAPRMERIISFDARITVNQDSSMNVHEQITVFAAGNQIKRGVVREFPIAYADAYGNRYNVRFQLLKVLKDGKAQSHWIEHKNNGVYIYMGDKDTYIDPGIYTFSIEYTTARQLGYFKEHDELYWNVTGNGWRLPIEKARATVVLPFVHDSSMVKVSAYTGYQGDKGQEYIAQVNTGSGGVEAVFETTGLLSINQGLTIVCEWPKGLIAPPTFFAQLKDFLQDNLHLLWLLFMLMVVLVFYGISIRRFYATQHKKPIFPQFYPPKDMLPGAMRYISRYGAYDSVVFASDIVNMAVHGLLTIKATKTFFGYDQYTLENKPEIATDNALYKLMRDQLFYSSNLLPISSGSSASVGYALEAMRPSLARAAQKYFVYNEEYFLAGLILSCFGVLGAAVIAAYFSLADSIGLLFFVGVGIYLLVNAIAYFIMRGYTPEGLQAVADIEGFKLFLKTTEEDRLKIIGTPPTKNPELYEKYLPYAMALGVEKEWAQKFAPIFAQMAARGATYAPLWYVGSTPFSPLNTGAFASNFAGSFKEVISSSGKAPGSSSGGGGGGSSGGGGGGGGGGGF